MPAPSAPSQHLAAFWGLEDLWMKCEPMLRPIAEGFSIELLPEIDSTNSELMRRARGGRREAILLLAEHQTAGRGRNGKVWVSENKEGNEKQALTFSLGLPFAVADLSGLSLALGCALVESLDPAATMGLQLKWPNDVWVRTPVCIDGESAKRNVPVWYKLAGILVETVWAADKIPYLVLGVGLNIHTPQISSLQLDTTTPNGAHIAPNHATNYATAGAASGSLNGAPSVAPAVSPTIPPSIPPIGLADLTDTHTKVHPLLPADILHAIMPALIRALITFSQHGFVAFHARFQARDALQGQTVAYYPSHSSNPTAAQSPGRCGIAQGVDQTGALLVQTEHGLERVHSQEVSVRMGF